MNNGPQDSGILLVNKPKGWSSAKTVAVMKKKLGLVKVGHAGTLDPLATGLLVLLIGKSTKKFDEFQQYPKEYIAKIVFGETTATYDLEGEVVSKYRGQIVLNGVKLQELLDKKYTGEVEQTVPIYSAVKVKGVPSYILARKGKKVEAKTRKVTIYGAKVLGVKGKTAEVKFIVSSGTYIRSLASDIGKDFGYGGCLVGLVRTAIGRYLLENAVSLQVDDLD